MFLLNSEILNKLKSGIRKFQEDIYPNKQLEYQYAATHPQKPHTLLITCADSRINPEMITSSSSGELFVTRNVGNMVPSYGEMLGGVSAVIEYAVDALAVKHVVVCGHSDCGAMKALLQDESALDSMPTVRNWLDNATVAKRIACALDGADVPQLSTMTEQNVLLQMEHLRTHPSVARALAGGDFSVSGWIYDIGSGDIRIFDEASNQFHSVRLQEAEA